MQILFIFIILPPTSYTLIKFDNRIQYFRLDAKLIIDCRGVQNYVGVCIFVYKKIDLIQTMSITLLVITMTIHYISRHDRKIQIYGFKIFLFTYI